VYCICVFPPSLGICLPPPPLDPPMGALSQEGGGGGRGMGGVKKGHKSGDTINSSLYNWLCLYLYSIWQSGSLLCKPCCKQINSPPLVWGRGGLVCNEYVYFVHCVNQKVRVLSKVGSVFLSSLQRMVTTTVSY
jgi:hypothetical protein